MDSGPSLCTSQASSRGQDPMESEQLGSRPQVNQERFPVERTCPAVWTVRLGPGTRVSEVKTHFFVCGREFEMFYTEETELMT